MNPATDTDPCIAPALSATAVFAGLPRDELDVLARAASVRSFPAHAVIVNEGDRADSLFILVSGGVKFFVTGADGGRVVLGTQGSGQTFGEIGLQGGLRSASAVTTEASRVAVLEREALLKFLARHPESALAIIGQLIERTRALTERVRDLALLDVYGRLAKLLLSLAREEDGRLVVAPDVTQQEMGERIGASREMVSRILKDLKAGGYVRAEGRRLVIQRKPPRHW